MLRGLWRRLRRLCSAVEEMARKWHPSYGQGRLKSMPYRLQSTYESHLFPSLWFDSAIHRRRLS